MKVKELIEQLNKMNPELDILLSKDYGHAFDLFGPKIGYYFNGIIYSDKDDIEYESDSKESPPEEVAYLRD